MASLFVRQAARARRAARQRGLRADLSSLEWISTIEDFDGKCAYCDRPYWTLDHFIPMVAGGPSWVGNCIPSCQFCNNLKGALSPYGLSFVPSERIDQIRQYLERRQQGLHGWPPPGEPTRNEEEKALRATKKGAYMSTKTTQWTSKTLTDGKKILLYSDAQRILLQLCYQVGTEEDVATPSFRVAVSLTPAETVALAINLLGAASPQLDQMQADRTRAVEDFEGDRGVAQSAWQKI